MHYIGISTYQFIPYYASAIPKHTYIHPQTISEPVGLKVDTTEIITDQVKLTMCMETYIQMSVCVCHCKHFLFVFVVLLFCFPLSM